MKKIALLFFLILLVLVAGGILITKKTSSIKQKGLTQDTSRRNSNDVNNTIKQSTKIQDSIILNTDSISKTNRDTISPNWKTYTNNKLGITFQYPNTWTKLGEESNAINRSGDVMSIMVNLIDTISQSAFFIEYHLAPYGAELYKIEQSQFVSSRISKKKNIKKTVVAGNEAIESFYTMSSDIKGNIYNPPLRIVNIYFLDKLKTGEFHLRVKTPLPSSKTEIAKFHQLLSTFKFTNSGSN